LCFRKKLPFFLIGIFHQFFLYTLSCFHLEKTKNARVEPSYNFKSSAEITHDNELKVGSKDKVYLERYYHHTLGQVQIDETLMKI